MKIKFFKYFHFGFNWKLIKDKFFKKITTLNFSFCFTEQMKYVISSENQGDINKLLGLRNNVFNPDNSVCIGWNYNPSTDKFGLYIYMHNCSLESTNLININNTTKAFYLGDYSVEKEIIVIITNLTSYLSIYIDKNKFIINKDSNIPYNKLMTGYFGGQETPNNDFEIEFNNIKY